MWNLYRYIDIKYACSKMTLKESQLFNPIFLTVYFGRLTMLVREQKVSLAVPAKFNKCSPFISTGTDAKKYSMHRRDLVALLRWLMLPYPSILTLKSYAFYATFCNNAQMFKHQWTISWIFIQVGSLFTGLPPFNMQSIWNKNNC